MSCWSCSVPRDAARPRRSGWWPASRTRRRARCRSATWSSTTSSRRTATWPWCSSRYALYPHMTLRRNIEFPLRQQRVPAPERARRVDEAAATLGLGDLLDRKPGQLSGGQRQRVALARAIVRDPQVFLMDEPLSNLDATLRIQTRADIVSLQRRLGTTTIYVTHDQVEAMTMGHRIAVMRDGRLQQVAAPQDLYERPANTFVASFLGSPGMNLVAGLGGAAACSIRRRNQDRVAAAARRPSPDRSPSACAPRPPRWTPAGIPASVVLVEQLGAETHVICRARRRHPGGGAPGAPCAPAPTSVSRRHPRRPVATAPLRRRHGRSAWRWADERTANPPAIASGASPTSCSHRRCWSSPCSPSIRSSATSSWPSTRTRPTRGCRPTTSGCTRSAQCSSSTSFHQSLVSTLLYVLMVVPVGLIGGLLLAIAAHKAIRGMAWYRLDLLLDGGDARWPWPRWCSAR